MGFYNTMRNRILRLSVLQQGKGLIKVNGQPLSLVQPEILRFKVCNLPFNFANTEPPTHTGTRTSCTYQNHRSNNQFFRSTSPFSLWAWISSPTWMLEFEVSPPPPQNPLKAFFYNHLTSIIVTGGGHTSQVYAIRQALSKSIVSNFRLL